MRLVFADTLYWVAVASPRDPWHEPSARARAAVGDHHLVTTDEVLIEFLTAYARQGASLRQDAARAAHRMQTNRTVTVLPQTRASFLAGLDLYERRPDKQYSLTDCISMNAMRERGIMDILTNDHHFGQEGFNVLIRK